MTRAAAGRDCMPLTAEHYERSTPALAEAGEALHAEI
jgi:hypothetical protein